MNKLETALTLELEALKCWQKAKLLRDVRLGMEISVAMIEAALQSSPSKVKSSREKKAENIRGYKILRQVK